MLTSSGSYLPLEWQGTLVHRIDHIAQTHESSPAVKDGLGNDFTFAQMIQRANTIAAALLDANIVDGSNVGVFQEPSTDWICSLLAIMRVGAVYVPLDPRATTSRLAAIIEDCQPALILSDNSTEKQIPEIKSNGKIVNISRIYSTVRAVPNTSREDSTMAILYTSGSTGTPKGKFVHAHCKSQLTVERYRNEARHLPRPRRDGVTQVDFIYRWKSRLAAVFI